VMVEPHTRHGRSVVEVVIVGSIVMPGEWAGPG
jgi:hypothetical protein